MPRSRFSLNLIDRLHEQGAERETRWIAAQDRAAQLQAMAESIREEYSLTVTPGVMRFERAGDRRDYAIVIGRRENGDWVLDSQTSPQCGYPGRAFELVVRQRIVANRAAAAEEARMARRAA